MPLDTRATYQSFRAMGARRSEGGTNYGGGSDVFRTDFARAMGVTRPADTMSAKERRHYGNTNEWAACSYWSKSEHAELWLKRRLPGKDIDVKNGRTEERSEGSPSAAEPILIAQDYVDPQ